MEINYPNQCIVCKSTNKLRCTGCNLVSYCGRDHQLEHWPGHKSFCRAISKILKENNLSHVFENLDLSIWFEERDKIIDKVKTILERALSPEETVLLKFPRVCFVCREARQENLKNCSGCPAASFCHLHQSSHIHERNCSIMQNRFDLVARKMNFDSQALQSLIKSIGAGTKILESDDPPTSMKEFFDHFTKPDSKLSDIQRIFLSDTFSISLTLYSVLQMLYDSFPPEIIIHLGVDSSSAIFVANFWETLLHLLPEAKILKVVYIEGKVNHREEVILCQNCRLKKRKLLIEANSIPYKRYVDHRSYQKPTVIAYLNVSHPAVYESRMDYINTINSLDEASCPVVLTYVSEMESMIMEVNLKTSSFSFPIIYNGYNDFASLMFYHEQADGSLSRSSQFMTVFKYHMSDCKTPESCPKVYWPPDCFYPTICHVCRKTDPKITCNRCQMISYCGNKHRDQNWNHHKDVCNAILSLLREMGTGNLFQNAKQKIDPELWLRTRIEVIREIQMKLARKLEDVEKQIFFFPKNCAVCHDNDSSVLRRCECGVNLCKVHKDDPNHKKLCKELTIAFKLTSIDRQPSLSSRLSTALGFYGQLPPSMQAFIEAYCEPSEQNPNEIVNYKDLVTSDFLTPSLTLNYAIKKFNIKVNSSMVIHIIGTRRTDLLARGTWKIFLYSLKRLKALKIIFIGTDIPEISETVVESLEFASLKLKSLRVEYHVGNYEKYFLSKEFIKPNIILGYNLNIHESEFGISKNSWKETILTLEKVGVPFFLTAGTKERAEKDHKRICDVLEKSVDFTFLEENPFASLSPERDFETEGVLYSNKFIMTYDGKYKSSSTLKERNKKTLHEKPHNNDESCQLEEKVSKTRIESSEVIKVKNGEFKLETKTENGISEVEEAFEKMHVYKTKEIARNSQVTSASCENLTNGTKLDHSESFLMKHNSFLKTENERLRKQLSFANTEIAKLKNQILEFQEMCANFVEKSSSVK